MKSTRFFWGIILLAGATFMSCEVTDELETGGTAWLNVRLTDAPGDFDAVFIDVQHVRVHRSEDLEPDNGEAKNDGWTTINDEPVRVDLLELRNGNTIQLGDEELDAGNYNQIRLVLGPDNTVVIDGESFPLKTPSAQQSGLKLQIDARIEEGEIYKLLIDFDAGRSIVETDNGKFILKPVLRAVQLEETGSIEGEVAPSDFQTSVMAIVNGDTLSTSTDDEGEFAIIGVTPGTYDVVFAPNSSAYADSTISSVTVSNDEDTELGTINLREL